MVNQEVNRSRNEDYVDVPINHTYLVEWINLNKTRLRQSKSSSSGNGLEWRNKRPTIPSSKKCFNVGLSILASHTMQPFHVIHLKNLEILESQRFRFLEAKIPVSDDDPIESS